MSFGRTTQQEILDLIYSNQAVALIGDASGLQPSAADGNLYFSLHTGNPDETGNQETNEIAYTGYARVAVSRSTGFNAATAASPSVVTLVADVTFGEMTGGAGGTVTHWAVGTAASGTGKVVHYGTTDPDPTVENGTIPKIKGGVGETEITLT